MIAVQSQHNSSRQYRQVQVAVVGGGAAALLLGALLRDRGVDVLLVAGNHWGCLQTMCIDGLRFNPIPLFPVRESLLTDLLGAGGHIAGAPALHYRFIGEIDSASGSPAKASSLDVSTMRTAVLTSKLFGDVVRTGEYPSELCRKIERQYASGCRKPCRVGYANGVSPYLSYIESLEPLPTLDGTAMNLDPHRHRLVTAHYEVEYGLLVSTIPLPAFLQLCDFSADTLSWTSSGASFYIFQTSPSIDQNIVTYDCVDGSPVYRYFSPCAGIVVVQLCMDAFDQPPRVVAARLRTLQPSIVTATFRRRLSVSSCYPLDLRPEGVRAVLTSLLRPLNIMLFGRFATWEYRDLHELPWSIVDDIGQHW